MGKGSTDSPHLPSAARTTTLDDPLTTSLLAEITRRSTTIEVSPEQLAEALAAAAADDDDASPGEPTAPAIRPAGTTPPPATRPAAGARSK